MGNYVINQTRIYPGEIRDSFGDYWDSCGGLFPVFSSSHPSNGGRSSCQSNLKQIALGFTQYAQDYSEKFPPASVGSGQGWANAVQPYIKSWQLFRCPTAKGSRGEGIDYFYNRRVARLEEAKFEYPAITILLGDGTPDSPTNTSLLALPQNWLNDPQSPAFRHLEGANYAFADGHVKWVKPGKITLDSPKTTSNYTFLPQ